MTKVNHLLTERFKKATEKLSKMTGLAELSSSGNLSSFAGVFKVQEISVTEKESLLEILTQHSDGERDLAEDLRELVSLTAEVRAISNQAAILHGERIKRAQQILKSYQDGAFTAWLITTYGNRQTPYNFLQYYELYSTIPPLLHPKLDSMPRQAVYALASRKGAIEQKERLIDAYNGQPKQEMLSLIRESFPLEEGDRRVSKPSSQLLTTLSRLLSEMKRTKLSLSERTEAKRLLRQLTELVES